MEQKKVPLEDMMKSFCVGLVFGYPAAFEKLDNLVRDHVQYLLRFRPEGVTVEKWEDKIFPELYEGTTSREHKKTLVRIVTFS